MCTTLVWFFEAIVSINWLEVIKALAPVATAIIAFCALRNWQRQDKAKREVEFIDALTEATHAYIAAMSNPITILDMIKSGMNCHRPTWEVGDETDKAVKGAIAYIQKRGEQDSRRLQDALGAVQAATITLRSLATKGQIFNFNGYAKCYDAVTVLTWHFDRMGGLMFIVASPLSNWENPLVLQRLKQAMAIDPSEIRKSIGEKNVEIIEFARAAYKQIYG